MLITDNTIDHQHPSELFQHSAPVRQQSKSYSNSEKQAIIALWKKSGFSINRFCREQKLTKSSLYKWTHNANVNPKISKQKISQQVPLPATFSKLECSSQHFSILLEVHLKTGTTLKFFSLSQAHVVVDIIRGLI